MEMERQIKTYITNNLVYLDKSFEYDDNTSLIGDGLIDSVGIIELIGFVNTFFGITVDQQDSVLENFDSVNKIAVFIRRKRALLRTSRQSPVVSRCDSSPA